MSTSPTSQQLQVLQTGAMRTRLDSSPSKPKPKKRQCAEPGCDTLLCSFNEAETCALHRGWPTSPVTLMEHRDTFVELLDDGFDGEDEQGQLRERREAA